MSFFIAPPMTSAEHLLFFAVANITIKPSYTVWEFIKKPSQLHCTKYFLQNHSYSSFLHACIIYRAKKQRGSNHTTYKKSKN